MPDDYCSIFSREVENLEYNDHHYEPAHVFTLRLWQEELSKGEAEWRLQLRSVETGRIQYFRDWPSLVGLLLTMLPAEGHGTESGGP